MYLSIHLGWGCDIGSAQAGCDRVVWIEVCAPWVEVCGQTWGVWTDMGCVNSCVCACDAGVEMRV